MNNSEKEIRNLESIAASINKLTKDTEAATRRDEYDTDAFNKAIDGYIADFKSLGKNYEIKKDPNANGLKEKQETAEAHQEAAKAASGSSNEGEKKSSVWRMLAAGAAIAAIGIGAYLWVNRGSADEDAE